MLLSLNGDIKLIDKLYFEATFCITYVENRCQKDLEFRISKRKFSKKRFYKKQLVLLQEIDFYCRQAHIEMVCYNVLDVLKKENTRRDRERKTFTFLHKIY